MNMKFRRMNDDVLEIYDEENNILLSIAEELKDNVLNIKVSGQIKNEVAHDFEDEVMAALSVCKHIIIDFAGVTYVASMTLKSLLAAQRIIDDNADSSMTLIHISPDVKKVFNESGFSDILMIEED